LSLHLDQSGRAYHRTTLAPVFPRRGNELVFWQKSEGGSGEANSDEENVQRSTLNAQTVNSELRVGRWALGVQRFCSQP
jgi:hypothetical protein